MSADDFANLFGAASTGVQNVTAGVQRVTDETVRTEVKLQETIDEAKQGVAAWGAGMLVFSGITAFTLLWIAGRIAKKTRDSK